MKNVRRFVTCVALCVGALLSMTGAASAGTIRYDIPPTPAYTVDNTSGIAKVEFVGCVTQNQLQTISFTTIIEGSKAATAVYKVLKEPTDIGELPAGTFSPNPVQLNGEATQSISTTLTFQLAEISPSGTVFRFKLDPAEGSGLGQGPGVQVKINCVVAAAPVAGPQAEPVPTVVIPDPAAGAAAGDAPCISLQRVTVRAGEQSIITATVRTPSGNVVNKAFVRVTGPGVNVGNTTNASGVVTFTVIPTKAGTLIVQSNVCTGADQQVVLAAINQSPAGPPMANGAIVPTVSLPSAVAGVAAGPSSCVTLRRVTLRAGQLSTITAVVRTRTGALVNRAFVRISGLGITRSGYTNASGTVSFRVRPRRSGNLIIQSSICTGADRKPVLAAAVAGSGTSGARPSFTG